MYLRHKIFVASLLVIVLAGAFGVYLFRNHLSGAYRAVQSGISQVQKTDLGKIADEFKREILSPPPLNAGGVNGAADLSAAKIIAQTNIARFDNGNLPPLIENATLDAAAKAKADDMFAKQYFDHVSPTGVNPGQLAQSFGYDYIVEGENLILGNFSSEKEVVQDWMNSPEHRANILNNRFVDIGVAIVHGTYRGQGAWIGVQEFGLPISACQQPDTALKSNIDKNQQQLDSLAGQIDQQRQKIDQTNSSSPQYRQEVDAYNSLVDQYNALNQETKTLIIQYNQEVNTFNECAQGTS